MINVKRLVIAVRGNTPYHYWRDCKEVDKFGMFQVHKTVKDGTYDISTTYILYKKKTIADWNEVMDIIEALQVERLREKRINQLLNDE
jgi:hypothetical protein